VSTVLQKHMKDISAMDTSWLNKLYCYDSYNCKWNAHN
jgi:hypothetical protein